MTSEAPALPRRARRPRLLPALAPLALLDAEGRVVDCADLAMPGDDVLVALHRQMVLARRFDSQATALTKQGRAGRVSLSAGPGSG